MNIQDRTSILRGQDVAVTFRSGSRELKAVDGVDISIAAGEALAVVGESGSGKTTLAMALMRAQAPTRGRILFEERDVTHLHERSLTEFRRQVQMVFQDPYSSLDPAMTIEEVLGEPMRAHGERSRSVRRASAERDRDEFASSSPFSRSSPCRS